MANVQCVINKRIIIIREEEEEELQLRPVVRWLTDCLLPMPITPRLRTIRRPPPDAGTLTAMIKAALTKSWNLTKAPQRGHGRVARRWLRTRVCSADMRGGKESRIWFQPLRTCVSSTLPAWSSKKDPVNKATGVPETLDLLHQQFSDTAENKPLEGYVVDVKDSFVKVTGVSSASIGGYARGLLF